MMVLEGALDLELEGRTLVPRVGEEIAIRAGVVHIVRPRGDDGPLAVPRWLYARGRPGYGRLGGSSARALPSSAAATSCGAPGPAAVAPASTGAVRLATQSQRTTAPSAMRYQPNGARP